MIRTNWHSIHDDPVRVGWYETSDWSGGITMDYWDGQLWLNRCPAYIKQWRGLTECCE